MHEFTNSDFYIQCLMAYNDAAIIHVFRDEKSKKINVVFECEFDPIKLVQELNNNKVVVKLKDWLDVNRQLQSHINKVLQEEQNGKHDRI